jgi:cell division septation protein DedD
VARDFAKQGQSTRKRSGGQAGSTRKKTATRGKASAAPVSAWRWYGAGLLTGVFLSFLVYLGTLPPTAPGDPATNVSNATPAAQTPPKPRFDFYKMLPEQTIEETVEPAEVARPRAAEPAEIYLLQAGSFRQRQDADARRAELLLLGLEPRIEEANGDNGRWYRVFLGPYESRSQMSRARGLTAAQGIDTLLLKRTAQP